VTTDQRVVAKQEMQEVESANRAGAPYAHHHYQVRDKNIKLLQQLANAPRARRWESNPEPTTNYKNYNSKMVALTTHSLMLID
jgi:hypothetical protein